MSQFSALPRSMIRRIKVGGSSVPDVKGSLTTSTSNRRPWPDLPASRAGSVRAMRCAISVGASGSARRATTVTPCDDTRMTGPSSWAAPRSQVPTDAAEVTSTPCDTPASASRCRRYGQISSSSQHRACSHHRAAIACATAKTRSGTTPARTARRATDHAASVSGPGAGVRQSPATWDDPERLRNSTTSCPASGRLVGGMGRVNRSWLLFTGPSRAFPDVFAPRRSPHQQRYLGVTLYVGPLPRRGVHSAVDPARPSDSPAGRTPGPGRAIQGG